VKPVAEFCAALSPSEHEFRLGGQIGQLLEPAFGKLLNWASVTQQLGGVDGGASE
jgi:hypothetical protein